MTREPEVVFLTLKEAAGIVKVSVGYIRNSDCPKVLLPTQGKRPIVRVRKDELLAWAEKWTARNHLQLSRAS